MQLEVLLTRAMLQVPTHTQTTLGIHRVCTNSMLFHAIPKEVVFDETTNGYLADFFLWLAE